MSTASPSRFHPAPARRLTPRGVARYEKLLDVAAELFLAHGYSGVCLDDIILQAGGSKASLYAHFGSKPELFACVVDHLVQRAVGRFMNMDYGDVALEPGLRRIAGDMLDLLLSPEHVALQRLVFAEATRIPAVGDAWLRRGPRKARRKLAVFLHRRLAGNGIDMRAALRAARVFHDMLVSTPLHLSLIGRTPSPSWRRAFADSVVADFLICCHAPGFGKHARRPGIRSPKERE